MLSQKFVLLRSEYFTTSAAIRTPPVDSSDPDRETGPLRDGRTDTEALPARAPAWEHCPTLPNEVEKTDKKCDSMVDPLSFHA